MQGETLSQKIRATTLVEKIGRYAWVGFIMLAAPCAILCSVGVIAALPKLFVEDMGPIESPPPHWMEVCLAWLSLVGHPVLWIASIRYAYRFNRGWKASVPFVLNLGPIVGMLWTVYRVDSADGRDSGWAIWYLGALAVLLVTGVVVVGLSQCFQSPSPALRRV